jgi:Acetyltransferase (GNAT) domain
MPQEVSIRTYRAGDEVGILALFNEVFGENNPTFTPRTLAHWNWQFRDNPLGHHTYVAEEAGGRIVGAYTAIPGRWLLDGAEFIGSQAVDTCVAKEYRNTLKREGVFLTLARDWFARYGQPDADRIVYGFPNPIAYRIGTKQLDYRPVHTPVVSLVRDFDTPWVDYLGGMGADSMEVRELSAVPPEADALFAAMATSPSPLRLVARRDRAYLKWRFLECPTYRYRLLGAFAKGRGELRGLLFFRTEWFDKPLAPLVDWVVRGDDQAAIAALTQSAARVVASTGKSRLETWAPPWSSHWKTLSTIGFAPDPSRFNLCIRVFGPPFDEGWAKEHWFYSMGDSDVY